MIVFGHLHLNFYIYAAKLPNDPFLVIHTNHTKFPGLPGPLPQNWASGGSIYVPLAPLSSALAPVRCSWQGVDISKGSQNILIYNFIITTFDCQGGSQVGGISARAFSLARPGVAPPLNQKLEFRKNNTE